MRIAPFLLPILVSCLGAVEPWSRPGLPVSKGLLAWFDASAHPAQETFAPGQPVRVWHDASGQGAHLRAESLFAPTWVTDSPEASYLRFDGLDDHFVGGDLGRRDAITIFMLVRPRSNTGEFKGLLSAHQRGKNDYTSGINVDLGPASTGQFDTLNIETAASTGAANLLARPQPFGPFQLISMTFRKRNELRCFLDGQWQGSRKTNDESIHLEEFLIGARMYRNEPGPPYPRGFLDGDVAEILIYDRALPDDERSSIENHLRTKYSKLLKSPVEAIHPLRVLSPGFVVEPLPLDVSNINDMGYDRRGRLWLLGYDGRIHVASDTDGDGLEDQSSVYWDQSPLRDPITLLLRPDGPYVSSTGKVSRFPDENDDGKADREEVVFSGWVKQVGVNGGIDALGMAFDPSGNLFLGIGCSDYTNAYLVKDEKSNYSLTNERGTILRISPDGQRSIAVTGIRFAVSLAFNRHGDLFATDQEGETWLPGGNPLDELVHIVPGRHYGFPPQHPRWLPNVTDEPAVETYGPQHQSTCGLSFNESVNGGPHFGPDPWSGDAIISGYSRGKIWRTTLFKDEHGYLARTRLIAQARSLLLDAMVSPRGDLIVSTHSGSPDWGTGPTGKGTLYRIRFVKKDHPQVVTLWPQSPVELRIAFDRPVDAGTWSDTVVEKGEHVRAGDRFEFHRPGYESVRKQLLAPRAILATHEHQWSSDRRTLIIKTDPQIERVHYALTLRSADFDAAKTLDLAYTLHGLEARSGKARVVIPHADFLASRHFTHGSADHESFFTEIEQGSAVVLRTHLKPWMGTGTVHLQASRPFQLTLGDQKPTHATSHDQKFSISFPFAAPNDITLDWEAGEGAPNLHASFEADSDHVLRAIPLWAFYLPWGHDPSPNGSPPERVADELAGGDWSAGKEIFFGSIGQCSKCHRLGDRGGLIGPNLSNLIHRDAASIARDVAEPNAAINPDFTSMTLLLSSGKSITGLIRPKGNDQLSLVDAQAEEHLIANDEVEEFLPSGVSIMPAGIADKIGQKGMRDLLTFLTTPEPKPPASAEGRTPPVRDLTRVKKSIEAVPTPEPASLRPLNIVLVSGPKDHDPGEHDYPIWRDGWSRLLAKAPNTRISVANEWPDPAQFELADALVFYFWNHQWSDERYKQLDAFQSRGGGVVALHSATIADKLPEQLALRLGISYNAQRSKYRHGPVMLDLQAKSEPILAGLPERIEFLDETYWNMFGEISRTTVLATAIEDKAPQPILWTYERGQGRVFASILGHYRWTFDDPYYRTLVLRGLAWTTKEPLGRFNTIILDGLAEK